VRSAHAANNGKIFAWDNPPETGNPSEDYDCRCVAEPYYGEIDPNKINLLRDYLLKGIIYLISQMLFVIPA
jgi:hypothetical protein